MSGKNRAEKYVFPRVPLKLEVPPNMPDMGQLNSMAVVPALERYQALDGELEIWGNYNLKIFYQPAPIQAVKSICEDIDEFGGFYNSLQKQAEGLFEISDAGQAVRKEQRSRIYSWELNKKFHTYAELGGLKSGGKIHVRPSVDKIELEMADSRLLKGFLTLALDIKRG